DGRASVMRIDLALDGMDILDRREVEILAPHEGPKAVEEARARDTVSGHLTGAAHGGALPIPSDALVIRLCRPDGEGDRGRAGVGAQAQIDAEDGAILGPYGQERDEIAREIDEGALNADRFGCRHDVGV